MANEPSTPQAAALYSQVEALDREQHRSLKLKPTTYHVAKTQISAALVCTEFVDAGLCYPIVFVQNEQGKVKPMAAFGVREGDNLFVNADGVWDAPYLPALVRQYPFTAAPDVDGKMIAAIDRSSDWLNTSDGMPLFDEKGEPAQVTQDALKFMESLQTEVRMTEQFCALLQQSGVLQGMDVSVPVPGGKPDERLSVSGFLTVNEEKLRALPEATTNEWFKNGALALVYAHLMSLRNFNTLMNKALAKA